MLRLKFLLSLLTIFILNSAFSQGSSINFNSRIKDGEITPHLLAQQLIANCKTDLEKVRSIFDWITANIDYNVRSYNANSHSYSPYWPEDDDTAAVLKPLNERVAEMVLKKKLAVCDGYARLFKTLCDNAGIRSEIITGYGRTNINRIGMQFKSNHKWNAVWIDNKWQLLDATWASGYINYRNEFERSYDNSYFLTSPRNFIYDHYPEDFRWALLSATPMPKEFNHTPFKHTAFIKYHLVSYKPAKGVIEASVGDTIVFELETDDIKKNMWVAESPFVDSTILSLVTWFGFSRPLCEMKGNKVSYAYTVPSDKVNWLNIIYNDEVIMRYKLNIKKNYTALK